MSLTGSAELSVQRRPYFVVRDLTYGSSVEGIVVGAFAGRVSEIFFTVPGRVFVFLIGASVNSRTVLLAAFACL